MGQVINSRDWILHERDGGGYIGYINSYYNNLYMIAKETTNGAVTSTRYYIAANSDDNDFLKDWTDRASLSYELYSNYVAKLGKLLDRFS